MSCPLLSLVIRHLPKSSLLPTCGTVCAPFVLRNGIISLSSVAGNTHFYSAGKRDSARSSSLSQQQQRACLNKNREHYRTYFTTTTSYQSDSSISSEDKSLRVTLESGFPRFYIPLPSRRESCMFTLQPLTHTVGDLCRFVQLEDKGVDRIAFYTVPDNIKIAQSCTIETLLTTPFSVLINDVTHAACLDHLTSTGLSATSPLITDERMEEKLGDLKNLVSQLHATLNIQEFQLQREQVLRKHLDQLRAELEPLEKSRISLAEKAAMRTRMLTWMGLGAMGLQFGILARLTWWEYSWDIMEPVTYFVGYGTAIAMFAYYVVTRQEYTFPAVFDRQYLKKFYKDARKAGFDVERYNHLCNSITQVESDIFRLRDPLLMNLPLQQLMDLVPTDVKDQLGFYNYRGLDKQLHSSHHEEKH